MLKVMTYELLFGKKKISGGGAVKRKLLNVIEKIKISLEELMISKHVTEHKDLLSREISEANNMPKYVRINEIKLPVLEEGYNEILKVRGAIAFYSRGLCCLLCIIILDTVFLHIFFYVFIILLAIT